MRGTNSRRIRLAPDGDWDSLYHAGRGIALLVLNRLRIELDELGKIAAIRQHFIDASAIDLQAVSGQLKTAML
jgi:hypothetical protein